MVDPLAEAAARPNDNPKPCPPPAGPPLLALVGPTASGKSHLALRLAERFSGEILSCDSVCVYRGLEIGAAKPCAADRALIPHHLLDLVEPDQSFNAGDWARHARESLVAITARGRLPIIAGGTGLYLRALLDGLHAAPPVDPALRIRLRDRASRRGPAPLHRLLSRFDPPAANRIHPNDTPKLVRALELVLSARQPLTALQPSGGRDALTGHRVLRLALNPPRAELYQRINQRAAAMFDLGLVEETARLLARYGPPPPRALQSLGYAQATAVLAGTLTREAAVVSAQAGHRQYAKRQLTWFRRDPHLNWMSDFGDDPATLAHATTLVEQHLRA